MSVAAYLVRVDSRLLLALRNQVQIHPLYLFVLQSEQAGVLLTSVAFMLNSVESIITTTRTCTHTRTHTHLGYRVAG